MFLKICCASLIDFVFKTFKCCFGKHFTVALWIWKRMAKCHIAMLNVYCKQKSRVCCVELCLSVQNLYYKTSQWSDFSVVLAWQVFGMWLVSWCLAVHPLLKIHTFYRKQFWNTSWCSTVPIGKFCWVLYSCVKLLTT